MRTVRREHRVLLAAVAVLLLATAWGGTSGQASAAPALRDHSSLGQSPRDQGTLSSADLTDSVAAPILGSARTAEPRSTPLWVLPGLPAALAALCLFRRQRLYPNRPARRVLLRGSVANRAPPLGSFA